MRLRGGLPIRRTRFPAAGVYPPRLPGMWNAGSPSPKTLIDLSRYPFCFSTSREQASTWPCKAATMPAGPQEGW